MAMFAPKVCKALVVLQSVEFRALALREQGIKQKRQQDAGATGQCPILPSTHYTGKVTSCQGKGGVFRRGVFRREEGAAGNGRDAKKLKRLAWRTLRAQRGGGRWRRLSRREKRLLSTGVQGVCRVTATFVAF